MLNSLLYVSSQYHNKFTFIRKALELTVDFWGEIILLLSPSAADLSSPKAGFQSVVRVSPVVRRGLSGGMIIGLKGNVSCIMGF